MARGVLIVEDDQDVRETLGMVMESEGYEVYGAANGKDALALLKSISPPDIIITDIMMPVMTGWEFLESAAENPALASIPVIILSAAEKKESSKHPKVLAFLPKPVPVATLMALIKAHS
jgi:CheY-like chemotaxis protein